MIAINLHSLPLYWPPSKHYHQPCRPLFSHFLSFPTSSPPLNSLSLCFLFSFFFHTPNNISSLTFFFFFFFIIIMIRQEQLNLHRSSSSCRCTRKILPSTYTRSSSESGGDVSDKLLVRRDSSPAFPRLARTRNSISALLRSLFGVISFPIIVPTCRWLSIPTHLSITPSLGRKVTGTLFGHRRGHVSFAVQDDPRSEPVLLLELATSTSTLVKEMSSGLVRIALECEKGAARGRQIKLFQEPMWTMYCNGRKCGYAVSRECGEFDRHVLSTVQSVSAGAGVIPTEDSRKSIVGVEGEMLYMRARFERVVGSRDSEAFYMMNPDGTGGPELSIFLLRI